MNDEVLTDYLLNTYGVLTHSERCLVWDSFQCHKSESTKTILRKIKMQSVIIPGGCTGMIQAANVCWNKPVKDFIQQKHDQWMIIKNETLNLTENSKKSNLFTVCGWVRDAWKSISNEIIKNSFKICGLTVNEDGSEDHMITCLKRCDIDL
jgi:hypothetical protein